MNDRLLLSACWLVYLVAIATSGGFITYLAGWQHPVAWSGVSVFAGLVVMAWWGKSPLASANTAHPYDAIVQTVVHCLPLLLLAGIGNQALGRHAAQITSQTIRAGTANAGEGELTLSDVYRKDTELPTTTTLIGMAFVPSDSDYARLPGGLTRAEVPLLLYRFEITCCAADAAPIFVVLTGLDPGTYPNDTWLRVTGVLTPPGGPANMARLDLTSSVKIEPPTEPYLSRRFRQR